MRILFLAALAFLAASSPAVAFEESGRIGPFGYRVLGPDWIWQAQTVNVVITAWREAAESSGPDGGGAGSLSFRLEAPEGAFEAAAASPREIILTPPPAGVSRGAFVGWIASAGVPLGRYRLRLSVSAAAGGPASSIEIPVRIIRGQAVPPGALAILLPSAVALLFSVWIGILLCRWAPPAGFRSLTPEEAAPAPEGGARVQAPGAPEVR